ncbi:phage tail tape measure protein [Frigoribacterium sp. CFBP 8759]|uniref:phage tail tape measure protein n=1 Tax=Frigoribacterium sp. CFBP 8759 TaxID=2775283 RepID=UPI00177D4119|nr:phage tail tape measure protein [Frigoribacterium sp. CFBP 8759]
MTLVAEVTNYLSGLEQAAKKTRELGNESEKLAQKGAAIEGLGKGLVGFGGIAAAAVGLAVAKFAEFDAALSGVQAATHATEGDMKLLSDAAVAAGASTVYSATEAAGAIEELSKAGLTTADILNGGLSGALDLAAAGGLEVADAAQQTAIALKQFGLEGDQASHVADLLAAGAGKAVGDVSDLGAALSQAGLVADGAGQSIEDTTGVLAAFADQGLLGSDAGTSLKSAIIALQAPTDKSREVMEKYNLSFYDGNGQMLSYTEIAGQLSTKLAGLTDEQRNAALAQIFGNDAIRSANVLYGQGAEGIQKYIDQTNDQGYAAETARLKLDNLRGDVERLGGAFDTALIQSGSGANDTLRGLVQTATALVDGIGSLPAPVLQAGTAVAAVSSAIALVSGAALLGLPKVAEFKRGLDTLGISGASAARGIAGIGGVVAVASVGLALYAEKQADVSATASQLADTLDKTTGAFTSYTRAALVKKLADDGAYEAAAKAGVSAKELTTAVIKGGNALDEVKSKLADTNNVGSFLTGEGIAAGNATQAIVNANEAVGQSKERFEAMKGVSEETAGATDQVATGFEDVQSASEAASTSVDDLKAAIEGFGSAQLDVNSSTRDFEAALDGLTDSVTTNGSSLDVGTEKGRANQAALDQIAQSTIKLSSATLEQTGSQDAASAAIANGRQKLIEALGQFGINGQAAEDYADRLGLIPSNINTQAQITGLADAEAALANLTRVRQARIQAIVDRGADVTPQSGGTTRPGFAFGGAIEGPGTATSDSVPIWASAGEHMLDAQDVANLGGQAGVYAMRAALDRGVKPWSRYAEGGAIDGNAYRATQYVTYANTYQGGGGGGSDRPVNITVQSKGGIDLTKYVEIVVDRADQQGQMSNRMGKQVR